MRVSLYLLFYYSFDCCWLFKLTSFNSDFYNPSHPTDNISIVIRHIIFSIYIVWGNELTQYWVKCYKYCLDFLSIGSFPPTFGNLKTLKRREFLRFFRLYTTIMTIVTSWAIDLWAWFLAPFYKQSFFGHCLVNNRTHKSNYWKVWGSCYEKMYF
jgi:hypothetical protein